MSSVTSREKSTLRKYWSGLSWSIFAVIAKAVLGIGASIVFVRYLGDTGYGQVVVMADFVTMAIVLLSQGLGVVQTRVVPQLMVKKKYGQVKDFIYKIFAYRWTVSLVVCLFIYSNLDYVHSVFFSGVNQSLIVVALVLIPLQMIGVCFRGVLEVTFYQKFVSLTDVASLILRILVVIPVIYYDLGVVWFFITQAITDAFSSLVYGYAFWKKVWCTVKNTSRQVYGGKIWSTGFMMMLILLANKFLGKEMDTQILSFRLGSLALPEIALYSVSFALVMRSLSLVGIGSGGVANLTQAVMSELSEHKNLNAIRTLYESQICLFYFVVTPLIFGGGILATRLLNLLYGEVFYGKGAVCTLLYFILGGTLINNLNYFAIFSLEKERLLLFNRFLWGCSNIVLSYLFASYGAIGVTIATGISLLGIATVETYFVATLIHPRFPIKSLIKILTGSLVMSIFVVWFLNIIGDGNNILMLLGAMFIGVMVYSLSMFALKPLRSTFIDRIAIISLFGDGFIAKLAVRF